MTTKIIRSIICGALALTVISGCSGNESSSGTTPQSTSEAGGNTPAEKRKIYIEYQANRIQDSIEQALEEKFDLDIVANKNSSQSMLLCAAEELSHDMAPDIYIGEFLPNLGDEVLSEYFYDLSAESFVNRYYLSTIENISSPGGGLYFLPGPSFVYGIVYDKTAFEQFGLEVPKNYNEFAELCRKVDEMGLTGFEPDPNDPEKQTEVPIKAFVPTMKWSDMFQIVFNCMNYESSYRGVSNTKWLSDYTKGEGSLVGHMDNAAEKYKKLFEDGILSLDMWQVRPLYRSKKLYEYHTSLMTIECQQGFAYNERYGTQEGADYHEVGFMPIYSGDSRDSGYLYAIPRAYFAVTKTGASDPEKLAAILEIFDYLSTTEGQRQMIDSSDYFGFLKNDSSVDSEMYGEVMDTIKGGRVISNFYLGGKLSKGKLENYLHSTTDKLVNGEISVREWLEGADEVRDNLLIPDEEEVFGRVSETLLPVESAYVEGLAIKSLFDSADIGYVQVANDYGTTQHMFSGTITDKKINLYSPTYTSLAQTSEGDMDFVLVEATGEQLLNLAKSRGQKIAAFSGAEMSVKLHENGGEILEVKINGEPLSSGKTYRIAAIRGSVPDLPVLEEQKDVKFSDLFKQYLNSVNGVITKPTELSIIED